MLPTEAMSGLIPYYGPVLALCIMAIIGLGGVIVVMWRKINDLGKALSEIQKARVNDYQTHLENASIALRDFVELNRKCPGYKIKVMQEAGMDVSIDRA